MTCVHAQGDLRTYVRTIWIREVVYVQQMWRAGLENSSSLERVPDSRGVGIERGGIERVDIERGGYRGVGIEGSA